MVSVSSHLQYFEQHIFMGNVTELNLP